MLASIKKAFAGCVRVLFKLLTLRLLYPITYLICATRPVQTDRVVFIELRQSTLSNNFRLIYDRLEKTGGYDLRLCCLRRGFSGTGSYISACLHMVRQVACARYVFISEGSTVFSCLPIRKKTTVIQTWHGCGALKRVGMSALGNGGNVVGSAWERRIFPMCRHMDFITISSPHVAWAYEEAFDLHKGDGQRIVAAGTSRTDVFFIPERIAAARKRIRDLVGAPDDVKLVLYAPTFRGETTRPVMPDRLDIEQMRRELDGKYMLLIKHHPVFPQGQTIPEECARFAFDMTAESIDDLLMAADICISDYSSLVFDYSLLDRPMIFFIYDVDEYMDWRGLYYPFEEFCPGISAATTQEVISAIRSPLLFDAQRMAAFREKQMSACDGHATDRIIALMNETPEKCL